MSQSPSESRSLPDLADHLERLWENSTPGEWMVYSSNSWRRIGLKGPFKEIIWPCTHPSDSHPDLGGPNVDRDLELLMELRNNIPAILSALRATRSEIEAPKRYADFLNDVEIISQMGIGFGAFPPETTAAERLQWISNRVDEMRRVESKEPQ